MTTLRWILVAGAALSAGVFLGGLVGSASPQVGPIALVVAIVLVIAAWAAGTGVMRARISELAGLTEDGREPHEPGDHAAASGEAPTARPDPAASAWFDRLAASWPVAAVLLLVAFAVRLPTLALPLTESHAWRQTQTAFTAVIYADEGIDLLHPQVPVFGPPWTLPFEFPLFQAGAALLISAGIQAEVALRGLALACFIGTAGVLWLLLRRHVNERVALLALIVFVFSPFALLWSRTSMIEYPATLGAVIFMLGTLEWHSGGGRRWFMVALIAGTAASLVKITTAVFWVAPSLLTLRWRVLILCAVPAVAGLAWTQFADAEKAASAWTAFLTSGQMSEWNLGGDRLDPDTWLRALAPTFVWAGVLLAPLALLTVFRGERLVWAWFAIALIGPLLLFTNLYAVHDYYSAAITPAVAALTAGGLDWLLVRVGRQRWVPLAAAGIVLVGVLASSSDYWIRAYTGADPVGVMGGAEIIRAATPGGEHVQLNCFHWSPAKLFYAERRGFAMDGDGTYVQFDDPGVC